MKNITKTIMSTLVGNKVCFHLFKNLNKSKLIILYYHRVIDKKELANLKSNDMSVDIDLFDDHMHFLKNNYNCISEDELLSAIIKGEKLPYYAVWITFDDGYKDNYLNAFPILKKYNIPATIFLTSGYINRQNIPINDYIPKAVRMYKEKAINLIWGNMNYELPTQSEGDKQTTINKLWKLFDPLKLPPQESLKKLKHLLNIDIDDIRDLFLTWEEIKEMMAEGISIGAHTVQHRILSDLKKEEIEREIQDSKKEIELRLNTQVNVFAYPKGKKNHFILDECVPVLKKNYFKLAVTTIGGYNSLQQEKDRFNLKRIGLSYQDKGNIFKSKLCLGGFWQR